MKSLWDEISQESSIIGLQVSDESGAIVASHLNSDPIKSRAEQINAVIQDLEKSAGQNLFHPDGIEVEFEKNSLLLAKANGYTITVIAKIQAKKGQSKPREALNRIVKEIATRPSFDWRKDLGTDATAPKESTATPAPTAKALEPQADPKPPEKVGPGAIHPEKVDSNVARSSTPQSPPPAPDALPEIEIDTAIQPTKTSKSAGQDDPIEALALEPKQKAILRIQQKALLEARERAQSKLELKEKEYLSLAEKAQARRDEIQIEAALPQKTLEEKRAELSQLREKIDIAKADQGRIKDEIKRLESEKTQVEKKINAQVEQVKLTLSQTHKELNERLIKQRSFADSKVALGRRSAEKAQAQINLTQEKLASLQSKKSDPDAMAAEARTSIQTEVAKQLQSQLEALVAERETSTTLTRTKFEQSIDQLQSTALEKAGAQATAKQAIESLSQQLETQRMLVTTRKKEIESEIAQLEKTLQESTQRAEDATRTIEDTFAASEQALSAKQKSLKEVIAEKDLEEETLRQEFERRLKAIQEARSEATAALNALAKEQEQSAQQADDERTRTLSSARAEAQRIQEQMNAKKAEMNELDTSLAPLQEELELQRLELDEVVAKQKDLVQKIETQHQQLEAQLRAAEEQFTLKEQEIKAGNDHETQARITTREKEIHAEFAQVAEAIANAEQQLTDEQSALEKIRLEIGESLTSIQEAESNTKALIAEAEANAEANRKKILHEGEEAVHHFNSQLEAYFQSIQEQDSRTNDWIAAIQSLEKELITLEGDSKKASERAKRELESLNATLANVKSEIAEAMEEVNLMTEAIQASLSPYLPTAQTPTSTPTEAPEPKKSPEPAPAIETASRAQETEHTIDATGEGMEGEIPNAPAPNLRGMTKSPFKAVRSEDDRVIYKISPAPTSGEISAPEAARETDPTQAKKEKKGGLFGRLRGDDKKSKKGKDDSDDIWG